MSMKKEMLVTIIHRKLKAMQNCAEANNTLWYGRHDSTLSQIETMHLPHGSGIDNGCKIDRINATKNQVVLTFGWHAMHENGYYCGWYDFRVVVTPEFDGISLRIVGRLHDVKDYLHDLFYEALTELYDNELFTDFNQ